LALVLGGEVAESLLDAELGDAHGGGDKGVLQRLGRVGVLHIRAGHGGVDQGDDAAQGLGGGEGGVVANGGDGLGRGVEVLLSGDKGCCCGDDLGVVAELGYDIVCELELICLLVFVFSTRRILVERELGVSKGW
jgi:hypothetical protein